MDGFLVDSNVILDIVTDDPKWADWSLNALKNCSREGLLYINSVIYSEVSVGFQRIEELEDVLRTGDFRILDIPKEALFLAGKAFLRYRRERGSKTTPLPDFFIGAQAAVLGLPLITRDRGRFATYFPTVEIISPG